MNKLTPEQSKKVLDASQAGGMPIIVGTMIVTKFQAGKNVSKDSGKMEEYAKATHSVLVGADVVTVTHYGRGDELQAFIRAANEPDKAALMTPAKGGDLVLVRIRSIATDKGLIRASGEVVPL